MAQIKNIKKPGDLIRGADVGLAALDKDGNVIGYKAAAADAGKVLTVGEDGSVTPAEGGGGESGEDVTSKFTIFSSLTNMSFHAYKIGKLVNIWLNLLNNTQSGFTNPVILSTTDPSLKCVNDLTYSRGVSVGYIVIKRKTLDNDVTELSLSGTLNGGNSIYGSISYLTE